MQLEFEVGRSEKHWVTFAFNKMWGNLTIRVDGVPIKRDIQMFGVKLTDRWTFAVGSRERHEVVIEKERKLLFSGFRQQICRAYVDGVQVAEGVA